MLSRRLLRTKVLRSLYSHFKSSRTEVNRSLVEYQRGVDKCYELYLMVLDLLVEIQLYAVKRQELAAAKLRPTAEDLSPNRRFTQNRTIESLAANERLRAELKSRSLSWRDNEEVVKELYNSLVVSDIYENYLNGASEDRTFVIKMLETLFEDNEVLCTSLEDMSMFWADDLGYAIGQAIRSIEHCGVNQILDEFKSPDDKLFGEHLFMSTIDHSEQYLEMIDVLAENWDLERIAYMDRLIILTALSEIVGCPTIPIKVSMDEYIEISKYYSTPSSSNFINGILNRGVELLRSEGRIVKTGRGLVDTNEG